MRTVRTFTEVPGSVAAPTCAMRAICRAWRASDACVRCRRNPARVATDAVSRRTSATFVAQSSEAVVQLRVAGGTAMNTVNRDAAALDGVGSCTRLQWRVHHDLPFRTRFRLASSRGRSVPSAAVEGSVGAVQGVRSAQFSGDTGSLLVLHDGLDETKRRVRHVLETLDLEAAATASALPPAPRNDVVKVAVLSLVRAALPPAPRAALQLVESLATLRARQPSHRPA